ncbi:MAG: ABC transporter substrate-binding protein [Synergistaceae bacterium]|nr:ABC transporter substrate-binding protein [Synergistaceae bacterium]
MFCAVGSDAAEKDVFVIGAQADANTMDPVGMADGYSNTAGLLVYEGLLAMDGGGNVVPRLAESYEKVDDLSYSFRLRKGVLFHNGDPVTADDVVYSMQRALGPKGAMVHYQNEGVQSVEKTDDETIVIRLKYPFTPFLSELTQSWGWIASKKAIESAEENGGTYGSEPVGTGPYKLTAWRRGDRMTFDRFDGYHGEKPQLRQIVLRAIPESNSRVIELQSGAVDAAWPIPPLTVNRIEQDGKLSIVKNANYVVFYIGFNCSKKPFDNPKVREAISLALDLNGIVSAVFRGSGQTCYGAVPPNAKYYDATYNQHEYNIEKAKALLAEAGLPDGFKSEIWTNDRKERVDTATIMQSQLKAVGIDIDIKVMESGAYWTALEGGTHDMYLVGYYAATPDFGPAMYSTFHSSQNGINTYTNYDNAGLDDLLERSNKVPDGDEREKIFKDIQRILFEDKPMVFMQVGENVIGMNKSVKGFVPLSTSEQDFSGVYF